jgi:arginine decarboxylase
MARRSQQQEETGVPLSEIRISTGVGTATTELAAFDAALYEAGIGDYNLLPLSSVIPPGAEVLQKQPDLSGVEWGDRLYVVLAEQRATTVGEEAWAGIGWVQETGGRRRGLFVEHHGSSEAEVEDQIQASLASMQEYRPEVFGPVQSVLRGARCTGRPVCALVAATYEGQPW